MPPSRSLELLWKRHERNAPGPKPALSLEGIIRAALAIVDREGMSALTMAGVAARLKVTTMALYRYVPGKGELVDLMIDAAFGAPPAAGGGDWRSEVRRWAHAELALFEGRAWLLETVLRGEAMGPNWLSWLNAALRALESSGLSGAQRMAAVTLVDGHVRSIAQISLRVTEGWSANFARVIGWVAHDARYSPLVAAMSDGSGTKSEQEHIREHFEFGLERILDGIVSRGPRSTPSGLRSRRRRGSG